MPPIAAWETPPQPGASRPTTRHEEFPWHEVAEALRARPGEWALLREGMDGRSTAYNVKHARFTPFRPEGAFDAVARGGRVYVRFIGTEGRQ